MTETGIAMPATLKAESLTRAGFAPFGQVVTAEGVAGRSVNEGRGLRHDGLADLKHVRPAERPVLSIYRLRPSALPWTMRELERHPFTSQTFLPMEAGRYLVAAAPTCRDGSPDLGGLRAFIGGPGQGICYRPGTWHCPLVALDREASFAMMMWEAADPAADCEILALASPITILS